MQPRAQECRQPPRISAGDGANAPASWPQARRDDWRTYNRYDWNRPRAGGVYYADDYYRDGRYYRERRLTRRDRIYVGRDGRYYCRRSDGTTGLIVGAAVGGLIGNSLDGGRSSLLGTLIGAGAGGGDRPRGRPRQRPLPLTA